MDRLILKRRIEEINDIIYRFLPEADEYNTELVKAVNYSVKAGGQEAAPDVCSGNLQNVRRS